MKRLGIALGVALCVSAVLGAPAVANDSSSIRSLCGSERWTVNTLQDRPRLLPVRTVTVRYLTRLPAPKELPTIRLPSERHIFRVVAAVTMIRPEDDEDYLVIL